MEGRQFQIQCRLIDIANVPVTRNQDRYRKSSSFCHYGRIGLLIVWKQTSHAKFSRSLLDDSIRHRNKRDRSKFPRAKDAIESKPGQVSSLSPILHSGKRAAQSAQIFKFLDYSGKHGNTRVGNPLLNGALAIEDDLVFLGKIDQDVRIKRDVLRLLWAWRHRKFWLTLDSAIPRAFPWYSCWRAHVASRKLLCR